MAIKKCRKNVAEKIWQQKLQLWQFIKGFMKMPKYKGLERYCG